MSATPAVSFASNPQASPVGEVSMAKSLMVTISRDSEMQDIEVKCDGAPDLQFRGRLLLTAKTTPSRYFEKGERWHVYHLYGIFNPMTKYDKSARDVRLDKAIVAIEGHSTVPGENVRYSGEICEDGPEIWKAMGKNDDLKPSLAEVGFPVVMKIT